MCKKYVLLAVCMALVITLIHAPDSWGKVRAAKTFDGKVWVRIDEVEGHPWSEIAAFPGIREEGNRQFFIVHIPFFDINFGLISWTRDDYRNKHETPRDRIGVVEQIHRNKWRSRQNCRFD